MKTRNFSILGASLMIVLLALAPVQANAQKFSSDPQHKVKLDFDRWHDVNELYADMGRLEKAYPKFLKLTSMGKSYEGRDIMVMTINNPETGPEMSKAAM